MIFFGIFVGVTLVAFVVTLVRGHWKRRAPVSRVGLDRLGPERAMFIRLPTRANTRRRRYRS